MNKRLLLGLGRMMLPIPRSIWQRQVAAVRGSYLTLSQAVDASQP